MTGTTVEFGNVSDNPEDLMKVFEQLESGEQPTEAAAPSQEPAPVKDEPKPANNEPTQQADQGQTNSEAEPQGVATKDGKHVIPYSVLQGERSRASRAEQIAREAQERVAQLEAQLKSGSQGANTGEGARTETTEPAAGELSNEDLEALKEDFPTVYKALLASQAQARALEAKLKPVAETVRQQEVETARTAAESVQDAIDATPKLAHIQANNAEAFELAKQFDAALRGQAAWRDKPLAERFAKVTDMVENAMGPIDLPGAKTPPTSQTPEALRKAAEARAAEAARANRSAVPTSLSEFPAGQPRAQDERQAAEQMNTLQLAEKFASMSPEQMDAYLQSL